MDAAGPEASGATWALAGACRRLPDRDPIGPGQLYQSARYRLCLIERTGMPLPFAEVLPLARSAVTRQHRHGSRPIAAWCSDVRRRLTDA